MPKGLSHFTSQELAKVLSHYDVGVINQVKPLVAGNSRAPKLVLTTEQGTFFLKRKPHGKDDPKRVAFSHLVQSHLRNRGFPIAGLVPTRDEHNTMLHMNKHIYELFHFVEGTRYKGSPEETADAGCQLANFHKLSADAILESKSPQQCFHDAQAVRRNLDAIESENPGEEYLKLVNAMRKLYELCAHNANSAGFYSWPAQVIHGDWHPGNMIYENGKIVAVLDFDSLKIAPTIIDIANGMLQFSIVAGRPNPVDWPEYLDSSKLTQFLSGYRRILEISKDQLSVLQDLMIETLISEAVLPVAATGFFGHLSGFDFLKMIYRKSAWMHKNRKEIAKVISA